MLRRQFRDYYVYGLYRRGMPFYIGMSRRDGRYADHVRQARKGRAYKDRIIRRTLADGDSIQFIVLRSGLTRREAFDLEIQLIAAIGRTPKGPLANSTRGGEGDPRHNVGWRGLSVDQLRVAQRAACLGKIRITDGTAEKLWPSDKPICAGWWRGRCDSVVSAIKQPRQPWVLTGTYKHSAEVRNKMRQRWKDRPDAAQARQRLGDYARGKHWFTDGRTSILAHESDLPPGDWHYGRSL